MSSKHRQSRSPDWQFYRTLDWKRNQSALTYNVRHSWATKYFSGIPGFDTPTQYGYGFYAGPGPGGSWTGTYAKLVAYWKLYQTRTDVVYCDYPSRLFDFTATSSITYPGQIQTISGHPADTLWNPDIVRVTSLPYDEMGNPYSPTAGYTTTYCEYDAGYGSPYTGYTHSTLSSEIDLAGIYDSARSDFTGHSWPLSWSTSPATWKMVWNDAPLHVGTEIDISGLSPSSYDGSASTSSSSVLAPLLPDGAICGSGWMIDYGAYSINLYRGQYQNTTAGRQYYWVGRLQFSTDTGGTVGGAYSAYTIRVISDNQTVERYGDTGSIVECPFDTVDPFPLIQLSTWATLVDVYFIVVGQTPTAWASAHGYTITSP